MKLKIQILYSPPIDSVSNNNFLQESWSFVQDVGLDIEQIDEMTVKRELPYANGKILLSIENIK